MFDSCKTPGHSNSIWSNLRQLTCLLALSPLLFMPDIAVAQNRVDLDDLNIKGELLSDNRLRLNQREGTELAVRIRFQQNFRPEITQALTTVWPDETESRLRSDAGVRP
jgi:hypothetical protein